jgi:hypothetical protein
MLVVLNCFIVPSHTHTQRHLTKKAEPPPTCDVNRDSGTDRANGGWLRRLVRRHSQCLTDLTSHKTKKYVKSGATKYPSENTCLAAKLFGLSATLNLDIKNEIVK